MDILLQEGSATDIETPLLAVGLFEGEKGLSGPAADADAALGGLISQLIADGEIKGSLNEVTIVHTQGKLPARRVAVVGLGKQSKLGLEGLRRASGTLFKRVRDSGLSSYAVALLGAEGSGLGSAECAQAMVEGALLAGHGYPQFKTMAKAPGVVEQMAFMGAGDAAEVEKGIRRGEVFAAATITARDLATAPPNVANPEFLAEQARGLAERYGLECTVLTPEEMEELGMGAILAVGKGSVNPPRIAVLRYVGDPESKGLLALVGKGITFDSGGVSIKGSQNLDRMKYDKAGAAAVLGAMQGIAELKPKVNVLGVIAAAENLLDAGAYRPGDIVRAMNGRTIEVISTDAEGRLVLADAMSYALEQGADTMVDVATLTGGIVSTLGTGGAGVMGNDEALIGQLKEAGDRTGDRVWPLPIWDDFIWEQVRSEFADIKNSGGKWASPQAGALLLSLFVGDARWAHIDMAGTAWVDKDQPGLPRSYIPRGATGFGARLLLEFALRQEMAQG